MAREKGRVDGSRSEERETESFVGPLPGRALRQRAQGVSSSCHGVRRADVMRGSDGLGWIIGSRKRHKVISMIFIKFEGKVGMVGKRGSDPTS